jgi:hypothetical protein
MNTVVALLEEPTSLMVSKYCMGESKAQQWSTGQGRVAGDEDLCVRSDYRSTSALGFVIMPLTHKLDKVVLLFASGQ